MRFPVKDPLEVSTSGLLEVCYRGNNFTICRVAKWAYMAVFVTEDTSNDEDEETRISIAAWHIDYEFGKKIMENNAVFSATFLSNQTARVPDLVDTIYLWKPNKVEAIRKEVESGIRKPMLDPGLDRLFKTQETESLKVFLDEYGENPQFSPKKVWVGMLMLLLYPLGLPFFYFNKPLWGWIMLGTMVLSCIVPLLLIAPGLLGCVLIVMLLIHVLGNHAKDKEGRPICTKRTQKLILDSIAKYKQNVAELATDGTKV